MTYLMALLCVAGIATGQILFKLCATTAARAGSWLAPQALVLLASSLALYGVMTIAWIWVLQRAQLGRIYPIMALAFVLVPLGAHLFLGERFQPMYFFGVGLIVLGIALTVWSA